MIKRRNPPLCFLSLTYIFNSWIVPLFIHRKKILLQRQYPTRFNPIVCLSIYPSINKSINLWIYLSIYVYVSPSNFENPHCTSLNIFKNSLDYPSKTFETSNLPQTKKTWSHFFLLHQLTIQSMIYFYEWNQMFW